MKAGRKMLSTFVSLVILVVVAECSKLPENHDVIRELTDAIQRLEAKVAETEIKRDEENRIMREEMQRIKQENSQTIQGLVAKVAESMAKRVEEMKQMKQQGNEVIAGLTEAMHRLEAKFAETEVEKDEQMKQMKKENSGIVAELSKTVQSQVADIDSLNKEFAEFTQQQGQHVYNSVICYGT